MQKYDDFKIDVKNDGREERCKYIYFLNGIT
jgi:hypothetical protein